MLAIFLLLCISSRLTTYCVLILDNNLSHEEFCVKRKLSILKYQILIKQLLHTHRLFLLIMNWHFLHFSNPLDSLLVFISFLCLRLMHNSADTQVEIVCVHTNTIDNSNNNIIMAGCLQIKCIVDVRVWIDVDKACVHLWGEEESKEG